MHTTRTSGARERCKNFLMEKTPYDFNPEVEEMSSSTMGEL
jgi:hypothetical protein